VNRSCDSLYAAVRVLLLLVVSALAPVLSFAQTRAAGALGVYVIDVEGGNSTLFVAPRASVFRATLPIL
jgi:hypothetical protein